MSENALVTKHGKALEALRERAHLSRGELCRALGWERSQYYRMCVKSKRGPTIEIMNRILNAMEMEWDDWAEAYEDVRVKGRASPRQKAG